MIEELFKENLKVFKAYEVPKLEYKVKLDANESFLALDEEILETIASRLKKITINRYPDAESQTVCQLYGQYSGISPKNIIAGNGSDELIQMIVGTFVDKNEKIMTLNPDFSMYKSYVELAGGKALHFELDEEFNLDVESLVEKVNEEKVKILFISNPNNPIGRVIERREIIKIIKSCNCIVVIDEAYFEFYGESVVDEVQDYENLIVLRTCSKAIAVAGIRLGFLITNDLLLNEIKKVKPPFNVNSVTQLIGEVVLENTANIKEAIEKIVKERSFLLEQLASIEKIKIYPTFANFILIQSENIDRIYNGLFEKGIIVRKFKDERLKRCLRITVGSRKENQILLDCLKGIEL
ncbi:histidinol-phosphate transaminase [Clostridium sp. A1-XYC3]|uniref:Histidinol-phosphate aminotransferase n=1 Tax=Clostridium tanneri TaxID=3037988 RepID=A0ABU4JSS3_9CLOT|nr:histidinol-phosphate transaminase [Clostridium sp. A1-XYC3]MDW8801168.1 histidinol-phosphate transaminase [Clostridium sp. A1-XYC3]